MTRQKKEIIRKIKEIDRWIEADMELGCGFAPPDAYKKAEEEIYKLQDELARLRHYRSTEEMLYDTRGQPPAYNDSIDYPPNMEQQM